MKRYLSYEEMTSLIDQKMPEIRSRDYDLVVAVLRGGMTAAHYIAKELRLKCGVIFMTETEATVVTPADTYKRILVVEDLVSEGRTYELIKESFDQYFNRTFEWDYMPLVVDANSGYDFDLALMKTDEWIVFPFEKMEKVTEGDRGLFRNGTDVYSKGE